MIPNKSALPVRKLKQICFEAKRQMELSRKKSEERQKELARLKTEEKMDKQKEESYRLSKLWVFKRIFH